MPPVTTEARTVPVDPLVLERMRGHTLRQIGAALALHHEQVRREIERGEGHQALAALTEDLSRDGHTAVLVAWGEDFVGAMAMLFWVCDGLRRRWPDLSVKRGKTRLPGVLFEIECSAAPHLREEEE